MPKAKRPTFKGFSYADETKPLVKVAYFDGYAFGDRMLEGVSFKAQIDADGHMSVAFTNPDGRYEQGLNQKKWLKDALAFAEEHDIFCEQSNLRGEDLALETE